MSTEKEDVNHFTWKLERKQLSACLIFSWIEDPRSFKINIFLALYTRLNSIYFSILKEFQTLFRNIFGFIYSLAQARPTCSCSSFSDKHLEIFFDCLEQKTASNDMPVIRVKIPPLLFNSIFFFDVFISHYFDLLTFEFFCFRPFRYF